MASAADWKAFYAAERSLLGEEGLEEIVARAPLIGLAPGGAIVFPHTKLGVSGHLPAAAASSVIASGCEEVLAIGVLHGGNRDDASRRGIHRSCPDEFSLDGFAALLDVAARVAGRRAPRISRRYPFLTGEDPDGLRGMDEMREIVARGAAIVATADPIHHGHGYGTPPERILDPADPATAPYARASVYQGFDALARRDYAAFLVHAQSERSDFRDAGPVLAALLPGAPRATIHDLVLVDYADTLGAPRPTWVAAALASFV
ncbi:MAG: hypothetical protein U0166_16520 [Acidobacteriota bacterium]